MDSNSTNILTLRSLCAFLTAAAIVKLQPKTQILRQKAAPWGFYCDCLLSSAPDKAFPLRIEECIGDWVRSQETLKKLEMVPSNAADYLEHLGQSCRAEAISLLEDPTISLFQLENYADTLSYAPDSLQKMPRYFSLIGYQDLPSAKGEHKIRLYGAAFEDAAAFKKAKKTFKNLPPESHQHWLEALAMALPLKEESGWDWLPRGFVTLEAMNAWWKRQSRERGFGIIASSKYFNDNLSAAALRHSTLISKNQKKIAEWVIASASGDEDPALGLMDPSGYRFTCATTRGEPKSLEQDCISSLQNLLKISKIFDFSFHRAVFRSRSSAKASGNIRACTQVLESAVKHCKVAAEREEGGELSGPSLELRCLDIWGNEYCAAAVGFECQFRHSQGEVLLVESFFAHVERLIGIILEARQGELPLLIAPEQVQVICVASSAEEYAHHVLSRLLEKGFRAGYIACQQRDLAAQMHRALSMKIPYVAVIGAKEAETQTVSVRAYPSETMEGMKVEEILEQLFRKLHQEEKT